MLHLVQRSRPSPWTWSIWRASQLMALCGSIWLAWPRVQYRQCSPKPRGVRLQDYSSNLTPNPPIPCGAGRGARCRACAWVGSVRPSDALGLCISIAISGHLLVFAHSGQTSGRPGQMVPAASPSTRPSSTRRAAEAGGSQKTEPMNSEHRDAFIPQGTLEQCSDCHTRDRNSTCTSESTVHRSKSMVQLTGAERLDNQGVHMHQSIFRYWLLQSSTTQSVQDSSTLAV
jgi:hypothetical protein